MFIYLNIYVLRQMSRRQKVLSERNEAFREHNLLWILHVTHFNLPLPKGIGHVRWICVLTAETVQSCVTSDITLCRPEKINRRCGGTYRFRLQRRTSSQAINQQKQVASWVQLVMLVSCFASCSTLTGEEIYSSGTSLTFSGRHSVRSKKTELFTTDCHHVSKRVHFIYSRKLPSVSADKINATEPLNSACWML
jgi:hypothetical protein